MAGYLNTPLPYGQPGLSFPVGGSFASPYALQPLQQILQVLQLVPQQLQQLQQLEYLQQQQLQHLQQLVQIIPSQLAQLQQLIQVAPQQQTHQPFAQFPGGLPLSAPWGISPQAFGAPSHIM